MLHTIVPDHWVPITLIARQRGWSQREVGKAAFIAGTGHTVSTLLIGLVVWIAGVAVAIRFGNLVSILSSVALIAFGTWIALSSLRELRSEHVAHSHDHGQRHDHDHDDDDDRGEHGHRQTSSRTALLLILGSSPMVEGLPAFFAAGKYGPGLIAVMAAVFATATIATYMLLCVSSTAGLRNVRLGALERYGEVLSGSFIALVGLIFLFAPLV